MVINKIKNCAIIGVMIVVLTAVLLTVSGCKGSDTVELNVYNWGEYISDGSEGSLDVNKEFENYCKEKGLNVKVNYSTFDSNESMYNKLKSGAVSYDIVIPSEYMIARMIAEDMLLPLDITNIPNFEYIYDEFKTPFYDPDPDKVYSVPYFCGYLGIIYNTKYVDESDTGSWDLLWNEKYSGKILQINNPRDAFGTVQYKNKTDVNSTDEEMWRAALEELKTQKPLVQSYVMDEIFNKMQNESAYIAPYYVGDFFSMYEENENLAFYFPEEGTNVFVDAMCIPSCCKNKEVAEMYINFMLEAEIGAANCETVYYATPNKLVNEDEEYIAYMTEVHEDAMSMIAPEFEEGYITSYYENLDEDTLLMMNTLWEELKIDSSSNGITLYIVVGVIVAGVAALIVFRIIKKKRRMY